MKGRFVPVMFSRQEGRFLTQPKSAVSPPRLLLPTRRARGSSSWREDMLVESRASRRTARVAAPRSPTQPSCSAEVGSRRSVLRLVVAAALSGQAAPPTAAVVLLPKTKEQVEASASRARLLDAMPTFPLLDAQRRIEALLADEASYRTVVALGLPTGQLQMPPMIETSVLLGLELRTTDAAVLRAAASEYAVAASKAEELLTYAEEAQLQKDSAAIRQNLDGAFAAVATCKASLQRMLAVLPTS